MFTSLDGWKVTATGALVHRLPLQSYASALVLVEAYLSNVGGWTPTDPADPLGEGEPANSATPEEAADDIAETQYANVYDMDIAVPVVLSVRFPRKLNSSLTEEQALAAIQPLIENWLEGRIDETTVPFRISSVGIATGSVESSGEQTTANRVEIQETIAAGGKLIDPRAIAVSLARSRYDLDETWNASTVYTEDSQPIVVIVEKYLDDDYEFLDPDAEQKYVLEVNSDTYTVTAGSIVNV